MASSIQSQLNKAFYDYNNRMQALKIELSGQKVTIAFIKETVDKYGNNSQTLGVAKDVHIVVDFPMNDIPTSFTSSNDNSSSTSSAFHMYDILPITAQIKNEDLLVLKSRVKGAVILYPLKSYDGNVNILQLQIVDINTKGNSNAIIISELVLSPVTSWQLSESEAYQNLLAQVKENESW